MGLSDAALHAGHMPKMKPTVAEKATPPRTMRGSMLAENRQTFRAAPWAVIAPGVAIMITLLAVNLFADPLTRNDG